MIEPISPDDVTHDIPDGVIFVFNLLIQEHWDGRQSRIRQKDILYALECSENLGLCQEEILSRNLLDVEPIYREAGWKVEYHKPDYNADNAFAPYFEFKR